MRKSSGMAHRLSAGLRWAMPSRSASKASPSQGASVRFNSCSNYPAWELAKAPWTSDKLNLVRYNILFRHTETELLPLCRDQGGVVAYNPLAGGFLTGRYQPGQDVQAGAHFGPGNAGPLYRQAI